MRAFFYSMAVACFFSGASVYAQAPYSGGDTSVSITSSNAYSLPAKNLSFTRRDNFFTGNAFFKNPWVSAPASTTARDGLGPLFNTNTCQSCHVKDGRGRPPVENEIMTSMLIRVGLDSADHGPESEMWLKQGVIADPNYGAQIQNRAINGLQPEAKVNLVWVERQMVFSNGESFSLRYPSIQLSHINYGPLHQDVVFSGRTAPAMIGMGLLENIPEATLAELVETQMQGDDNVSGRMNRVWDVQLQQSVPGRFGWKAGQPTVRQQVASAFANDIGITSTLFSQQPCTATQIQCKKMPSGGDPEINNEILDLVTFYSKTLAVPTRRKIDDKNVHQGEEYFREIGCNLCHIETLHTGVDPDFPELSEQEIHPYTDLLLHDMGEGLADHRREFLATGREWRTAPLWGIGLMQTVNGHTNLLHDGRARNVEEAILWHGGEAHASRQGYLKLSKPQREKLLAFIDSL